MPSFIKFDVANFLRDAWQKQPFLIRDPWREWSNPLDPDELAGLSCEPEVESRLVLNDGPDSWKVEHGPIEPSRFGELGGCPWTLLVQAVDHQVPAVAELIEPFRFIPNWRIDDVMVSYAVEGGGVGAHFDQYDVFLVQGRGRRRWRIGRKCDDAALLLPHEDLRLLADFQPTEEWELEPGDILYVPPGFAHEGVAVGGDCMTYSIGFRAPSRGDLLSAWTDHVLETLREDDRYGDPDLATQANPGEILPAALDRLQEMAVSALMGRKGFASWFGEYATAPKNENLDWTPDEQITLEQLGELVAGSAFIERNSASRFAFVQQDDTSVTLFVDGASWHCSGDVAALAKQICSSAQFAVGPEIATRTPVAELVLDLVNRGCIGITDGE